MNDPGPFIAAALSGLCSHQAALIDGDGTDGKGKHHIPAAHIAARAVAIGVAAAEAYAAARTDSEGQRFAVPDLAPEAARAVVAAYMGPDLAGIDPGRMREILLEHLEEAATRPGT